MVRGKRSSRNCQEGKRDDVEIVAADDDIEIVAVKNDVEAEDWCFVCKDGGRLRLCDHPKCGKSYHCGCVGKRNSFMRSPTAWQCARHSCLRCEGIPVVTCYCCPNALCYECLHAVEFHHVGDENGFCEKCVKFVLYIEGETKRKPNCEDSFTTYEHFAEYYWITKKKYGFTLDDLLAAKKGWKSREKRKSSTLDEVDVKERLGGVRKMKLDSSQTSQNEEVISDIIKVVALVPENVKLIYLTRSVIEKLLMQPESFEGKVKRTFVGIELPQKGVSNKIVRQLVQVTGITKTSFHDGQISIKLQAKNMPNDISIDMVSDHDFSEILCKDLRQQVKDGLIEMPAVEELEQMARVLSEVMVDDLIAREMRRLQIKIDLANEKGWRQEFFQLAQRKGLLQTSSKRLQLIHSYPTVTKEVLYANSMSAKEMNETQEIEGSPEPIPISVTLCENDKIASRIQHAPRPISKDMMDGEEKKEGSPNSIAFNLELNKDTSSVSKYCKKSLGISHPVQEVRKLVNEPVSMAPVSLTTKTVVNSHQQFLEMKHNKVIPEQNGNSERTKIKKPVAPTIKETHMEQQSRRMIPSPGEGGYLTPLHLNSSKAQQSNLQVYASNGQGIKFIDIIGNVVKAAAIPDDQVREINEELVDVADHSNLQRFAVESTCNVLEPFREVFEEQKRFDVMDEEFENNANESCKKILVMKDKLDTPEVKMEDELLRLKGMTHEDPCLSAAKLMRMEEKIDRVEQQIKQLKEEKAQSEEAILLSYNKKSEMFMDALLKLMEPVSSLACTKTLEEIKAKYLPDLDLRQFPTYDPNAIERVHPLLKGTVQSFIHDGLAQRGTIEEEKASQLTLELQPLASQPPDS